MVWDTMMKAGWDKRVAWMQHVLPIYVVRFSLTPGEALKLYSSMDLGSVFGPLHTSSTTTFRALVKGVHPRFLRDPSSIGGMHMLPTAEVPDTRCVQSLYLAMHSISLPSEYAGQGPEEPCSDSDKVRTASVSMYSIV